MRAASCYGRRSGEEMAGSGRRIKEGRGVTEMEDGGSAERDECCRRGGRDRQGRRGRVVLARCGHCPREIYVLYDTITFILDTVI